MNQFESEIWKIPQKWRSIQTEVSKHAGNGRPGSCYFGAPPCEVSGRAPLQTIPAGTKAFYFYMGSDVVELLADFVVSHHTAHVEALVVGNSSYAYAPNGARPGRDFREAIATLEQGRFPKLKVLNLGAWELFHNAHCMYGNLGDITHLLGNTPQLENLNLFGHFELEQPLDFKHLQSLHIELNDPVTCVNGGPVSQATLNNLLFSQFPILKDAYLDLEVDDHNPVYSLTDSFIRGDQTPRLEKLMLSAFLEEGQKEALLQGPLGRNPDVKLSYEEPEND